jgi:large subunit ribosomal protein L21
VLRRCAVNDTLYLNKVLLVGSREETIIGTPLVTKASVMARVEEHTHTDKVYAFKKRRRKNSQRTRGIRHPVSALRIVSVESEGAPEAKTADAK